MTRAYIYGLFFRGAQIDQTSLDEKNKALAWQIMVTEEKRKHPDLSVELIEEVEE